MAPVLGGPGGVMQPATTQDINNLSPASLKLSGLTVTPASQHNIDSYLPPVVTPENRHSLIATMTNGHVFSNNAGHILTSQENNHLVIQYLTSGALVNKANADQLLTFANQNGMTHVVGAVPKAATGLTRAYARIGARPYADLGNGWMLWSYPPKGGA
jgi:hypothetical protein